jgi:hypothetical protein
MPPSGAGGSWDPALSAHDSIADTLRYIMVSCLGGLIFDDGPFHFHLPGDIDERPAFIGG